MLPADGDCDECKPGGMPASTAIIFSSLPFIATFFLVSTLVLQKLFPFLSGDTRSLKTSAYARPFSNGGQIRPTIKHLSAPTFSSTIALAAVLVELILCEISNTINPAARGLAFKITVSLLLFFLIIAIPLLEIHSIISAAGYEFTGSGKGRLRLAWIVQLAAFTAWLLGFWWTGQWLLHIVGQTPKTETSQSLSEASLERIGVIGISIMSLLSGFASVSSPWQNFFSRPKPITEATLARKAAGLEATQDMLITKRSRLRALESKMSSAPSESFFQRTIGSIRGNADCTERQSLLLEISGLETMAVSLSTSHANLQSRLQQQNRSRTATGRLLISASYAFSLFCLYRITTTTLTFIRRSLSSHKDPSKSFTTSDPVDNIIALLATHYDPHLDQAAWARQISFLLSGLILFASFSSVMQTFSLFARWLPSLLRTIQANLALVVAQVCGTYVISAALMLRGMMPGAVVGEGLGALGGKEGVTWVDGWFERWFLGGAVITALGIWVGRKVGVGNEWDDDEFDEEGGLEGGKRI
ncbi:hypothetical protein OEA41_003963 [Lepraria neglecta]|uniref:Uncharacterized protein n=1 Tax=Lepraria neglecta TaxID=209136 RepID=A0AAE0DJC7_9LECA|nr:hypothetical protein OEA41_003963 [Lepraria neglecta]